MRWIPVILLCPLLMAGCPKNIPVWNKKIYVGNSKTQTLDRKQDNEAIPSSDPRFDQYIAVRKDSYDCFVETYVSNCKEWTKQSACGLENEKP